MKKLFALLLTAAMVFSFMAMSGSAFAADDNTLSVYAWDANFNIPALKAAEAAFQKVNPDFKLEIATQSGSQDVEQAMTLAGSSGDLSSASTTALPSTTAPPSLPTAPTCLSSAAILLPT